MNETMQSFEKKAFYRSKALSIIHDPRYYVPVYYLNLSVQCHYNMSVHLSKRQDWQSVGFLLHVDLSTNNITRYV